MGLCQISYHSRSTGRSYRLSCTRHNQAAKDGLTIEAQPDSGACTISTYFLTCGLLDIDTDMR